MRQFFLLTICFMTIRMSFSQNIGINPDGAIPDVSSGLDINFSNKGLLIPRICLTSNTDITTIPNPTTSLLVYCTGSCGLSPAGFYYWDGSQWKFLSVGAIGPPGPTGATGATGPIGPANSAGNAHCFTCDGF